MKPELHRLGNAPSVLIDLGYCEDITIGKAKNIKLTPILRTAFTTVIVKALIAPSGFAIMFLPDKDQEKEFHQFRNEEEIRNNQFMICAFVNKEENPGDLPLVWLGINLFPLNAGSIRNTDGKLNKVLATSVISDFANHITNVPKSIECSMLLPLTEK